MRQHLHGIARRIGVVALVFIAGCPSPNTGQPDVLADVRADAGAEADIVAMDAPPTCTSDLECSDAVFCNGSERCAPSAAGANARGCIASPSSACPASMTCNEAQQRCETTCTDADGDGHRASSCGGDDCDDGDANRFPGNPETCDAMNHDEDCDSATFGARDADGDGHMDAQCCNVTEAGTRRCGRDCDDSRAAINPDAVEACDLAVVDENCDGVANPDPPCTCADGQSRACTNSMGACSAGREQCVAGHWGMCTVQPTIELCNDADDDCDGMVDEGLRAECYVDADGDQYAPVGAVAVSLCRIAGRESVDGCPVGYTNRVPDAGNSDCSDSSASQHPGATEVCNHADDDCDGATDEGVTTTRYYDSDGDGEGTRIAVAGACSDDPNTVANPGDDCVDDNAAVHHGQTDYFETPYTYTDCGGIGCVMRSSWDYDCDGTATPPPPLSPGDPCSAPTCGQCVPHYGYTPDPDAGVAQCGMSVRTRACSCAALGVCSGTLTTALLPCR